MTGAATALAALWRWRSWRSSRRPRRLGAGAGPSSPTSGGTAGGRRAPAALLRGPARPGLAGGPRHRRRDRRPRCCSSRSEHVVGEKSSARTLESLYEILLGALRRLSGLQADPRRLSRLDDADAALLRAPTSSSPTDPAWRSLADVPPRAADRRDDGNRRRSAPDPVPHGAARGRPLGRFPMATNEAALEALHERHGRRRARLGPCPVGDAARTMPDPTPIRHAYRPTAAGDHPRMSAQRLLGNETFLRTAVDQAIAALTADGTIAGILEKLRISGDRREGMTIDCDAGRGAARRACRPAVASRA